ncbi:hypothetical protein KC363_g7701 [Hortaea werneckii]|uniref:Uncharacterized protein n=1 Tax=Hortaea werneckii TaxID=91943 RepID=A0A3M7F419_HORWE|nr:hypothetical protein KC361_g8166 [Hortaea werneckii]KAI6878957.1 hypothetical protein KC325_g8279 [Hortaea werneckii]KAI6987204.1 hypothetical protein KC359_g8397 [Hortaea werneckii]KAI7081916.1 hypothetical protein KC356_g8777 [Hortaea werneckii]KAI7141055.1 hypothetical protein KC344_g8263 [Hortaea werneckii]
MPKPYGQRGRPHDVFTDEHRFKHLHGTATAAHREGPRNRQPMVDRAWSRDLAAGGGGGQTISAYDPRAMRLQCPGSNNQHWSYGAAYGLRNPSARPSGVAPPHDGYTPGTNNRLLYNQFQRDQINIKWRGHQ